VPGTALGPGGLEGGTPPWNGHCQWPVRGLTVNEQGCAVQRCGVGVAVRSGAGPWGCASGGEQQARPLAFCGAPAGVTRAHGHHHHHHPPPPPPALQPFTQQLKASALAVLEGLVEVSPTKKATREALRAVRGGEAGWRSGKTSLQAG
jgi:hypothetical protein